MSVGSGDLGRVIIAYDRHGQAIKQGPAAAWTDQPTVTIEDAEGNHRTYLSELCEVMTAEQESEYWRLRARVAEQRMRDLAKKPNDGGRNG